MEEEKKGPSNKKIDEAYAEFARKNYEQGVKADASSIVGVIVGSAMLAATYSLLLKPNNMITAGFSGLALLVQNLMNRYAGIDIPFFLISIPLNLFPAAISFKYIGKRFTLLSVISIILVSILTDMIPPVPIVSDMVLVSVFGGILLGAGISLLLKSGASSGGTDFISIYFSIKKGISGFNMIFVANAVMIMIQALLIGLEPALYTIIYQFVSTQVINLFYNRYSKKTLFIITNNPREVAESVMSVSHHGSTIFNEVEGAYTGETKHLVYSVVSASELNQVVKIVKGTDPSAFVNIVKSESVLGRFFQRPFR
ncbi:MAG: YitT family protein [Sphaerochaetaceae bacterium]|nr:YitT family protein [Sphaerochaetaceae bacterium]